MILDRYSFVWRARGKARGKITDEHKEETDGGCTIEGWWVGGIFWKIVTNSTKQ